MRIIAIVVVAVLVGVLTLSAGASVYQCQLHPMARLSRELHRGDRYTDVAGRFSTYMNQHATAEAQFNAFEDDAPLLGPDSVTRPKGLGLYDVSIADDLQLTARFDSGGALVETLFICD